VSVRGEGLIFFSFSPPPGHENGRLNRKEVQDSGLECTEGVQLLCNSEQAFVAQRVRLGDRRVSRILNS